MSLLKAEEPRVVSLQNQTSVVMITDACYEKGSRDRVCGLGGVIIDAALGKKFFFSCKLSEEQRAVLGEPCKKHIIVEAETLCAVLAYSLWTSLLLSRMCFLYVDNEATKCSLMKGSSDNVTVDATSHFFAEIETHVQTLCWISRASSFSNLADALSRGDNTLLRELGFSDNSNQASSCLNNLCLAIRNKLGKTAGQSISRAPALENNSFLASAA